MILYSRAYPSLLMITGHSQPASVTGDGCGLLKTFLNAKMKEQQLAGWERDGMGVRWGLLLVLVLIPPIPG